ncbi:MAG: hypothetical protein R2747_10370 [Pyrinomonadaceae bacterium]
MMRNLTSLQKTFAPSDNVDQARRELDEAIRFDLALALLMAEGDKKNSETRSPPG